MDFLATDGFDGENVGPGLCTELQTSLETLPRFARAHQGRFLLVANVGGGNAQGARQMILFVAGYEMPFEDGGDLRAPLRPIRHRRQKLKFQHDAGDA